LQRSREYPIVKVHGPRQTGKTTLLRELLPNYSYVTLDLPSEASLAETDPETFFSRHPAPVIIDEVQYAPGLFRHLKAKVDLDRHHTGQYVLTGSQKFSLMKELADSLAGRVSLMTLEGLSWSEVKSTGAELNRYLARGGFPELWRVPELPASGWFAGYVATYLERDVRQLLNVGDLRDFERFVRVLATRHSQQLDLTALGSAVGVTGRTAKAWLSVLEASNQIVLLEPWYGNVGKRIVKTPKVFFTDSGLVCWLLGVSPEQLDRSPFLGALWEGVVLAELRRVSQARQLNRTFWYYRDNTGTEVDFLVLGDGARLIEAKWTAQPGADDLRGLNRLEALARNTNNPELVRLNKTVVGRPISPYPFQGCQVLDLDGIGPLLASVQ
jgi:predicted AAA+ superfamily ATPase